VSIDDTFFSVVFRNDSALELNTDESLLLKVGKECMSKSFLKRCCLNMRESYELDEHIPEEDGNSDPAPAKRVLELESSAPDSPNYSAKFFILVIIDPIEKSNTRKNVLKISISLFDLFLKSYCS